MPFPAPIPIAESYGLVVAIAPRKLPLVMVAWKIASVITASVKSKTALIQR